MIEPGIFRHRAGFGKRMEYYVMGRMLKEGIDICIPLVDDNGIDAVVRKKMAVLSNYKLKLVRKM